MESKSIYYGATEGDIRDRSIWSWLMVIGFFRQGSLFPHHGHLWLEIERLVLEGWREILWSDVVKVTVGFTDIYTRFMAGGLRGQGPSLGFIYHGEPLILYLTEEEEPVYLLIDYNWLTGTNQNHTWHRKILEWLSLTRST